MKVKEFLLDLIMIPIAVLGLIFTILFAGIYYVASFFNRER